MLSKEFILNEYKMSDVTYILTYYRNALRVHLKAIIWYYIHVFKVDFLGKNTCM